MPGLPFLNDNANRHYPFVDEGPLDMVYSGGGSLELPQDAVVEFVAIAGLDAGFLEDDHRIYLHEVLRQGDRFYFTFRGTSPGLLGLDLVFCRESGDPEFGTDVVRLQLTDAPSSLSSSLAPGCDRDFLLEAWLTTGRLDALAVLLADGESLRRADGSIWIEPAQIQSLHTGFLRAVNLANKDRTKVQPPEGCGSLPGPGGYIAETVCIAGDIRWKPGYNCAIRQSAVDNSITIIGNVGGGEGEPCEEVALHEGETPPDGGKLLTGGPACDEVVKTINGVPGPVVRFMDGLGVRVRASDTAPHTLVVDINLHGLAICAEEPAVASSSSSAGGGP